MAVLDWRRLFGKENKTSIVEHGRELRQYDYNSRSNRRAKYVKANRWFRVFATTSTRHFLVNLPQTPPDL